MEAEAYPIAAVRSVVELTAVFTNRSIHEFA